MTDSVATTTTLTTSDPTPAETPSEGAATLLNEGTTAETTTQPEATPAPAAADWRESIEDADLRKTAEKFLTQEALVKSYRELQQKLSSRIPVPGEDASQEERDAFFSKLGRPETHEAYTTNLPKDTPEEMLAFAQVLREDAFAAGLTQAQYDTVVTLTQDFVETLNEQQIENAKKQMEDADTALRKAWGPEFEPNLHAAKRFAKANGVNSKVADLVLQDGTKLGNHPLFIESAAWAGKQLFEAAPLIDGHLPDVKETAMERIKEIEATKDYNLNKDLMKEREKLYDRMYGSQPVAGAA